MRTPTLILSFALVLLPSCSCYQYLESKSSARSGNLTLKDQGWLDIGAGWGYSWADGDFGEPDGLVVSLKAYPAGKWYSTVDSASITTELGEARAEGEKLSSSSSQKAKDDFAKRLDSLEASIQRNGSFYVLKDAKWYHRISVFVGTSLGEYNGKDTGGSIISTGLSYDIAPEFAVEFGVSRYRISESSTDPNLVGDLDWSPYFAFALNTSTMLAIFGDLAGG